MLSIHSGTQLPLLADGLMKQLRGHPAGNVLAPEVFVVQNYGMARWLSLHIAQHEGIAANFQFIFPAEIYWHLIRLMDPHIPPSLPSDRRPMSWAIFKHLQDDTTDELSVLQEYIQLGDTAKKEMRRWNLAGRIADVFDQYLTYRPDMLRSWENGATTTGNEAERWQAVLWNILCEHWQAQPGNSDVHRAAMHHTLLKRINKGKIPVHKLPERLSIFAVSDMPETYVKTLAALSKLIDIHFYVIDLSKNKNDELIDSLGQVGIEFKSMLSESVKKSNHGEEIVHFQQKAKETNLNFFQQFRANLAAGRTGGEPIKWDGSIQVHSCHSPHREAEVLYDQLLLLLDDNKDLAPSDILVLCPDMDTYEPAIEAIFGAVEEGVPKIPFHIAETSSRENSVNVAFRKLLNIVGSRFNVTGILDLIDSDAIRKALALSMDEFQRLEKWIDENNIRWGINAEHKARMEQPVSSKFTWQSGLNRMMAGYAMEACGHALFEGVYPYKEIVQTEDVELLGRFSRFLNQLFDCNTQAEQPRTLREWGRLFGTWLSFFFMDEAPYGVQVQIIRDITQSLKKEQLLSGMEEPISFPVVRSYLEARLENESTGGGRKGRGITFSGMVAMRNIPAKIVCMIGMNDGVFPKRDQNVEFNLIPKTRRPGDRLPAREDRQIFLESIIAAQKQIYFSYTGQSNKTEAEFPPSVVLRELLDYIEENYEVDHNKLVQNHRLQSFSKDYFLKESSLVSYSIESKKIAEHLYNLKSESFSFIDQPLSEAEKSFRTVSVRQLIFFFQHPAKYLLQQRLGINLREKDVLDEDRDIFDLNGLQKYLIEQEMLNEYLEDPLGLESFKNVAEARDLLPAGWPGDHLYHSSSQTIEEFGNQIQQELRMSHLDSRDFRFKKGAFTVTGKLDQIYEHKQLLFRLGKIKPKYLIELWIKHLLLQTDKPPGHSGISSLYGLKKSSDIVEISLAPVDEAADLLAELLDLYWQGLHQPICFIPESSYAFAENVLKPDKQEAYALKKAEKKWLSNRGYDLEGDDPYNKRLYDNAKSLNDIKLVKKFKLNSKLFWSPFFASKNQSIE